MATVHECSCDKRARFRGTLVKVKLSPTRKERIRLAKASVAKFRDELVLAGYDPAAIEKKLRGWDGNPATDPLEALINPKREDVQHLATTPIILEAEKAGEWAAPDALEREAELSEASKRDWLHRFDEVKA